MFFHHKLQQWRSAQYTAKLMLHRKWFSNGKCEQNIFTVLSSLFGEHTKLFDFANCSNATRETFYSAKHCLWHMILGAVDVFCAVYMVHRMNVRMICNEKFMFSVEALGKSFHRTAARMCSAYRRYKSLFVLSRKEIVTDSTNWCTAIVLGKIKMEQITDDIVCCTFTCPWLCTLSSSSAKLLHVRGFSLNHPSTVTIALFFFHFPCFCLCSLFECRKQLRLLFSFGECKKCG